ncbi:NAD(P)/FAD-dependent oxidoreductase [Gilvibacter sediminis]|uniref:NAD(P)/FAD-dependent oxidoreductase n=1 Tax=Gilvibacter sediminis TaxID=379071 RepID=UPI0023508A7F|nr:FAD-dependent oxidoreductase [Gilvibacter sediminis]MDC7996852.1 FAD-dependent oxidoreductase [Gilvibacter sediminis]
MTLSYWEHKTWFKDIDFAIIGSGIVGLSAALALRTRFSQAKITVLERGMLPSGASTKNAGFACFGSVSELLDDLSSHSKQEVLELVKRRVNGLESLKSLLGTTALAFDPCGGYELFTQEDTELYEESLTAISKLNALLDPIFKAPVFSAVANSFGFNQLQPKLIFNQFEGKIDTGAMMQALIRKAQAHNIQIINGAAVTAISDDESGVKLQLNGGTEISVDRCLIATNGLAGGLLQEDLKPARAQVLITEPIPDLHFNGTFHLDRGYYYFRNIDNRILFGGGRNLDVDGETTTVMETTERIQNALDLLLRHTILPGKDVKIEQRWSGIMGVGSKKAPIVKQLSNRVFCGIRLGGMGVAIGADTGQALANLID